VTALALVGLVAGARGAGRVHLMLGDDPQLVTRACDVLRAMGARFAMAEWPDDGAFTGALRQLRDSGFHDEGRIADYYRAGVDQVILRRDL
jgi:ribosomal protein S18 acetylase RimI-like enzyme